MKGKNLYWRFFLCHLTNLFEEVERHLQANIAVQQSFLEYTKTEDNEEHEEGIVVELPPIEKWNKTLEIVETF